MHQHATCGLGTKFKRHDHQVLVLPVTPLLDHIQTIQSFQSWAAGCQTAAAAGPIPFELSLALLLGLGSLVPTILAVTAAAFRLALSAVATGSA